MAKNAKCTSFVAMVLSRVRQAARENSREQVKSTEFSLSDRSPISPAAFLIPKRWRKMRNFAFLKKTHNARFPLKGLEGPSVMHPSP